jgi:ABC-type Fe3+-hydroxamate transport system substrate-binding protein
MKKLITLLLAMAMLVTLCACGGNDANNDDTANTTTTTAATTTTTTTATTTTTTVASNKFTYTVNITDEAGNPIPGVMVQMCNATSCLPPCSSNAQGVVLFENKDKDDYSVKFAVLPEGYTADATEYFFDEGSFEMTIVLKAAA